MSKETMPVIYAQKQVKLKVLLKLMILTWSFDNPTKLFEQTGFSFKGIFPVIWP